MRMTTCLINRDKYENDSNSPCLPPSLLPCEGFWRNIIKNPYIWNDMLRHFPPLPNIIFIGQLTYLRKNWSSLNPNCPTAGSLLNLTSITFLNQQVSEPTRNCNILDLIFCSDNIINFIAVSDTFLSDHRAIYAETLIPVYPSKQFGNVILPKRYDNP